MIYLLIAIPLALAAGALWGYAVGAEATERRYRTATRFFSELEIEERRQSRINAAEQTGAANLKAFEDYKTELGRALRLPPEHDEDSSDEEDERVRRWRFF